MNGKKDSMTAAVPHRLLLFIAVSMIGLSVPAARLAAQQEFVQKRYACLIAGAGVHAEAGRANKRLFDLAFGEEVSMGGSKTIRVKNEIETWVKVKRGTAVGWTLEYALALQRPKKEEYLEAPDSLLGTWTENRSHPITFIFKNNGQCEIDGCSSVIGGAVWGEPTYAWRGDEGTVTITAFGDPGSGEEGETAFEWSIRERTRFYLLVDDRGAGSRELFRSSLLARAVANGSINYLRALFANNRYAPADLDKHLVYDDYYDEARDPEKAERDRMRTAREEARRQRDEERRRWEEAASDDGSGWENEAWGPPHPGDIYPPDLYGDELLPPEPCTHATDREMVRLPLLGIALSARRYREDAALFLIARGADVDAFVKKDGALENEEPVNEPLLIYLKKHGVVKGCALLLKHGARTDAPDSAGRTYADLTAKESVRLVVPKEGLTLRNSPSLDGAVLANIPYQSEVLVIDETGDEVTIKGRTGRWTKVSWNDKTGWVFGGMLK